MGTVTIYQGKPKSSCFTIVQPFPDGTIRVGDTVNCINPQNNETTTGRCIDHWTFLWSEMPDGLCQLAYGVNALTLKRALEKTKPEFKKTDRVRLLLIEEIK